jgi:hypothetical protein
MHISASQPEGRRPAHSPRSSSKEKNVALSRVEQVDMRGRVIARWLEEGVTKLPLSITVRLERARLAALGARFGS